MRLTPRQKFIIANSLMQCKAPRRNRYGCDVCADALAVTKVGDGYKIVNHSTRESAETKVYCPYGAECKYAQMA